jgi:hypothetical protein
MTRIGLELLFGFFPFRYIVQAENNSFDQLIIVTVNSLGFDPGPFPVPVPDPYIPDELGCRVAGQLLK